MKVKLLKKLRKRFRILYMYSTKQYYIMNGNELLFMVMYKEDAIKRYRVYLIEFLRSKYRVRIKQIT